MSDLKPCPCGETPESITVQDGPTCKYAFAMPSCCNAWFVEFRNTPYNPTPEEATVRAEEAWNKVPRHTNPWLDQPDGPGVWWVDYGDGDEPWPEVITDGPHGLGRDDWDHFTPISSFGAKKWQRAIVPEVEG